MNRLVLDGPTWKIEETPASDHAEVELCVPPLVDCGAALSGYRESQQDPASRATDAIGANLRRHGVGTVVDIGSPLEARYRFAAEFPEITVVSGGPVLTDRDPRHESERQIRSAGSLQSSIDALVVEGARIINIKTNDDAFLRAAVEAARRHGLLTSIRTTALSLDALGASHVNVVVGAHHIAGGEGADIAAALTAIGHRSTAGIAESISRSLDAGLAVATGLLAFRRGLFPKEAIESPHLEELVPILPHARHLVEMRRVGGYLVGRRQLTQHAGIVERSPRERRAILLGWRVLLDAVAAFADGGGTLLPASHSPGLGIVPGFALKEEITLLAHAQGSIEHALHQATSGARQFLELPLEEPTLRAVGRADDCDLALRLFPGEASQYPREQAGPLDGSAPVVS